MPLPTPQNQPNQIQTLQTDLSNQVFENLQYIQDGIRVADETANFLEGELPEGSENFVINPNAIVRSGTGDQIVADNDTPAYFDNGYHIRSFCNYVANDRVLNDFDTFGGVFALQTPTNGYGYLSMAGGSVANPRGIRLPQFNANLPITMTMVIQKVGDLVPAIFFRPSFTRSDHDIRVDTSDGNQLLTVDSSYVAPKVSSTRHIQRAIVGSNNTFAITFHMNLSNRPDGSFMFIQNGSASDTNILGETPIHGTFLADFTARGVETNPILNPRDFILSPIIANCNLYYIDCIVGGEDNRRRF